MNCAGFNFVQWPRVFLTSNLWGQQITKKKSSDFPKRLLGVCFSLKVTHLRCHCKNCQDFVTNRCRVEMFQKQNNYLNNSTNCRWRNSATKSSWFKFQGNKSFSCNYFCSGKFCQNEYDNKSPMCCYAKWSVILLLQFCPILRMILAESQCFVLLILFCI